jgi:hypothetical protein
MTRDQIPDWAEIISKALLSALKERDPYTYELTMLETSLRT